MKIERKGTWIRITGDDGAFIESQSIELNLQFEILQKLEELRYGIIDVETELICLNKGKGKHD